MALSKKPVNGMKDILPAEMEIRDYVTSVIKETYRSFGFTPMLMRILAAAILMRARWSSVA